MGFIERFFNKKPEDVTKADLEDFINRRIEEGLNLEYKDIMAYDKVDDLSRIISAFANSDGGLLILGVSEEKVDRSTFPKEITWGPPSLSKERLENLLISRIKPRIEGLKIMPLRNEKNEVVFLIDVPKSDNPPHMAADYRYYKRWNFQVLPMEHFEVADLFGRRRRPKLTLLPQLENVKRKNGSYVFDLRFFVRNVGRASAKHVLFSASIFNADIVETKDGFQRLDEIRGCPSIQRDTLPGVLYPSPSYNIGVVTLRLKDPTKETFISHSLLAEDMPQVNGNFTIKPE